MEKRDNSGALFKAKENENPKWPGYEGSAMIDGKEYWLSAWVKEGKSGKFFSLAFKPKEAKPADRSSTAKVPEFDGDIPF
jgi:hypothetical protein